VGKYGRARQVTDDNIVWRMRIACWITKATDTHALSEFVILIAFPRQQWLRERALLSRWTHVACRVMMDPGILTYGEGEARKLQPV
jgi:hypothetical protein